MLAAIFFSLYLSLFAIFSALFDFFSQKIPFKLIFWSTLFITILIVFKIISTLKIKFEIKKNLLKFAIFLTIFLYFFIPTLPDLLPRCPSWDGANHIALANFLREQQSHQQAVRQGFQLSYGGNLFSYPWGFHAFIAGIALNLGNINVFTFIYPVIIFILSLTIFSWTFFCTNSNLKSHSFYLILIFLLFSYYGFFYMIKYNYWTQITGILILFSLIYFLDLEIPQNFLWVTPVILISGLNFIYPLFSPLALAGFFWYSFKKKKYSLNYFFSILTIIFLISVPLFSYFIIKDNLDRVFQKSGPVVFKFLTNNFLAIIVVIIMALFLIIKWPKKNYPYYSFPFSAFVLTILSLFFNIQPYWKSKFVSIFLLLCLPLIASSYESFIKWLAKIKNTLPLQVTIIFALIIIKIWPVWNVFLLKRALSPEEYRMRVWCSQKIPHVKIFHLVESPNHYSVYWNEAIAKYPRLDYFPRHLKVKKITLLPLFKPGDLIITNINLPENKFITQHAEGKIKLMVFN